MITAEQLAAIYPAAPTARILLFLDPLNRTFTEFDISTPLRIAAFLAQIGHESGQLRYVRELADGKGYEGRKDLGNTEPGDGPRFKGRGLIQITGRANYTAIVHDLGIDCVRHPQLLEEPLNAARVSGWFWEKHGLNELADAEKGDNAAQIAISGAINCGSAKAKPSRINGLADRLSLYARAKEILKC